MTRPTLSKSRYLSGLQCSLKLWNDTHARELATPPDAARQAILDTGTEIGKLATRRYPGGIDISADPARHDESVSRTADAMRGGAPAIYEAAFTWDDVRIRVDVLNRRGGAWELIEVKSGLDTKELHQHDVALQLFVAGGAGVPIERAGILTLDRDYVYSGGEHDPETLFKLHDLTSVAKRKQEEVVRNLRSMHAVIEGPAPTVAPGPQCTIPFECPYLAHCTRGRVVPDHPIDELPSLSHKRRLELGRLGIERIEEIPPGYPLTALQRRVQDTIRSGRPWRSAGLGRALAEATFPVYHLDFETTMFPVPRYAGTRPYQALPFLWSCHVESAAGEIEHRDDLAIRDEDPRRGFATSLVSALGDQGSICIYTTFERHVIEGLARDLPDLAPALRALIARLWDLKAVLREHLYHPGFHGSYSLKKVLPALVPTLGYDDLDIRDGQLAEQAWRTALRAPVADRERAFSALRAYCSRDTLALLELRRAAARIAAHTS